jgi:3-oxoacyl-[acyl-carrier protein] reductase
VRSLTGQVAIVTGAAQGIGRGIAEVLTAEQATVVVVDRNGEGAQRAADELAAAGHGAFAITADVTSAAQMHTMAATVLGRAGRIDVLASNAGIYPVRPLDQIDDPAWDHVMDTNAKGTLHALQACLPAMRRQGYGRVVFTASVTGPITAIPGFAHYGASKAAMLGLMRAAALELAGDGITVNAVMPGNVDTPGVAAIGAEHTDHMVVTIPLGEIAQPADIAWAVRFLASPEARYITGQTLVVDGGQVLPEGVVAPA